MLQFSDEKAIFILRARLSFLFIRRKRKEQKFRDNFYFFYFFKLEHLNVSVPYWHWDVSITIFFIPRIKKKNENNLNANYTMTLAYPIQNREIRYYMQSGPNIRFFPPSTAYPRGEFLNPKNVPLQGTACNLPSTDFSRPSTDVPVGTLY